MKKILKLFLPFIGIIICFVIIIRGGPYGNLFLLILIVVSIYFGIAYEQRKKEAETKFTTTKDEKTEIQPTSPKIPQEFEDEQEKFKQLNKAEGLE